MLIDIGSTTSDLIPLVNGLPEPTGRTDVERLQSGELVYSGVRRTPLCALVNSVMFGDATCRVAAELFATTLDLFLILGDSPENPSDRETANGRPATIAAAHDRIARLLCCDATEITATDLLHIVEQIAATQMRRLCLAASAVAARLPTPCNAVLISGSGSFLARRVTASAPELVSAPITSIPELLGPQIADSACAFAVAKLAAERELSFFG